MFNCKITVCFAISVFLNVFSAPLLAAEAFSIPLFIPYRLMQQLLLKEVFKAPGQSAVYRLDRNGCTVLNFNHPQLSGHQNVLQLRADMAVKQEVNKNQHCPAMQAWSGSALVQGQPLVLDSQALTVKFKVINAELLDTQGKPLNNPLLNMALNGQINPLLEQFKVDLKPQLKQLKTHLPFKLLGYSEAQADQIIDQVQLSAIEVRDTGLNLVVKLGLN